MSSRSVSQVLDRYHKARLEFAQNIAELSSWQSNIKHFETTNVIEFLVPLIDDKNISIRRAVAAATGRLSERSELLASQFASTILPLSIIRQFDTADDFYKRNILLIVRGISRHNEELAWNMVRAGVLSKLIEGLEHFDLQIKENSACAFGLIGRHSNELAKEVADSGAIPKLVMCLQQPDISLKQIVTGVLEDLARYEAQAVVDAGALPHLITAAQSSEIKSKKSALGVLEAICAHSEDLAKAAVEAGAIDAALISAIPASARILRNIVKYSEELAQAAVDAGACGILVQLLHKPPDAMGENVPRSFFYSSVATSKAIAPAAAALGFIAAQSDELALAVIASKAVPSLVNVLSEAVDKDRIEYFGEQEDNLWCDVGMCSRALGQIARHSPHHSEAVSAAGAFPILLQLYETGTINEEVKKSVSCALQQALKCCLHRPALEPLLHTASTPILECVLGQYTKILPHEPKARRLFVTTGALQKIQEISAPAGSQLQYIISAINFCFPEDIVRYYSPGHPDVLLEQVENFIPKIPELVLEDTISACASKTSNKTDENNSKLRSSVTKKGKIK